jgi:hypothetical protein
MDGRVCADHGALHRALLLELRSESWRLNAGNAVSSYDSCELLARVALVCVDEE